VRVQMNLRFCLPSRRKSADCFLTFDPDRHSQNTTDYGRQRHTSSVVRRSRTSTSDEEILAFNRTISQPLRIIRHETSHVSTDNVRRVETIIANEAETK